MAWIKRNLFFVVGAVVALALMGLAFFYLFDQSAKNNEAKEILGQKYEELRRINGSKDQPGNDAVDNIKIAREQQAQMAKIISQMGVFFQPVAPIPNTGGKEVDGKQFTAAMRDTVDRLKRDATNGSVVLPPDYFFSFDAQKKLLNFAKDSLPPLAAQLGEIKTICGILFAARVNSLDGIRRERVSGDDQGFVCYHDKASVTNNELATISHYEVTFRSFSAELGSVLAAFANSPHPMIVKSISIEPASKAASTDMPMMFGEGIRSGFPPPGGTVPPPRAGRGGLTPFINEYPVRVVMWVDVIKLKAPAK